MMRTLPMFLHYSNICNHSRTQLHSELKWPTACSGAAQAKKVQCVLEIALHENNTIETISLAVFTQKQKSRKWKQSFGMRYGSRTDCLWASLKWSQSIIWNNSQFNFILFNILSWLYSCSICLGICNIHRFNKYSFHSFNLLCQALDVLMSIWNSANAIIFRFCGHQSPVCVKEKQ